jgi:hypothetical protein
MDSPGPPLPVILNERSESKNLPTLRATMRKAARVRPGGDPSTHSSDSFAPNDKPAVTLSERVPPSESKGPPKQV